MLPIISRAVAKQNNLITYFTNIPCRHNHISPRYTNTGYCVQCRSIIDKQHRTNNQKIRNEQNKIWRHNNQYYKKNKQTILAKSKEWRSLNPHKLRVNSNIRNTALAQAIPSWYDTEEHKIQQIYTRCQELSLLWGLSLTVDHIIPLKPKNGSVCGLHCWANLQILESSYNSSKNDRYQTDW